MDQALFVKTVEGTPQGGVLSPLLANIYLNHFDRWFAEQAMLGNSSARDRNRKAGHANFMMVRYADDFVVFSTGTKQETEAFKAKMKAWLAEELHLELSDEKTALTHFTKGFDFLGVTIKKTTARTRAKAGKEREVAVYYPSTESVQRAIRKVSDMTARSTTRNSHGDQVEALNAFLRGWGEYFRHSCAKKALASVGSHAHMCLWKGLKEKDELQHGWRTTRAKYYREHTWVAEGKKLHILQDMKVEYPFYTKIRNPSLGFSARKIEEAAHQNPYDAQWTGTIAYGNDWNSGEPDALKGARPVRGGVL